MLDSSRFLRLSRLVAVLWIWIAVAGPAAQQSTSSANDALVFAAASLQTALDEIAPVAQRTTGVTMKMSYAASSALARQIENGAPADLFISADLDWMDYLAERRLIKTDTRVNLLGNELVLIAPTSKPVALKIAPGFPLTSTLGRERLALANPDVVPAGKYARAALTSLGVWDTVSGKLAPAENVRGALLLVARGESPLGIVYRTDAIAEPGVVIVDRFPASTHPPITYPVAVTTTARPTGAKILEYLKTPAARAIFEHQGFTTLARD